MADRIHLLHVKSNVAEKAKQYGIDDFLVTPKNPVDSTTGKATDDTLLYGEIAVNYGKGVEALTIRNTEDNVVAFVNENDFYEAGKIASDALATEKMEREEAIAAEAVAREQADISEANERAQAINAEASAREQAFNYLDTKIDTSAVLSMVSITYAEMKELRDQSKLKAGQLYRITDYVTTTMQPNTQSAGHQFDIIVLATDVDTLNENAKVIKHDGDTYFANSNLDAWEIKYDLDNDTTKYGWADETNGKGVIFYMKDEWNNECPYDFKNIQFKRWAITNITSTKLPPDALQALNNIFNFGGNGGKHFATKDIYGEWLPNSEGLTITVDETKFGWYYTFNGMSSEDGETINEMYDVSTKSFKLTDECIQYMEENKIGGDLQDSCYNNVIAACHQEYFADDIYYKGRMVLNNIVFNNGLSYCYYNEHDKYWEYNTSYCYDNRFDSDCYCNTFGNSCYQNTFGNSCYQNTFGNDCGSNSFGNDCGGNSFGNNCVGNSFGNNCGSNSFGNDCGGNSFGNYNNSNTFGNDCFQNTFGRNNYSNTFGNNCWYNTFGIYCQYNTFGNNVQHIEFVKDYMYYNIVENWNKYITVTSSQTTNSAYHLRNITIAQGVNNTTTVKTISHDTTNDTFKTIYQNANSKTVNV